MAQYGMDYGGDSGGGFGGGGFSQGGGGFGNSQGGGTSQREGGGQRRNYDEQTVLPVTIRMALTSHKDGEGDTLSLEDDRKLHHIKIVAAIRSVEDLSTHCLYQLEDGTGLIDCKQWVDDNDCTAAQELRQIAAREGQYVKVVGQLKDYDGKRTIMASSVRPLQTGNELTHHLLEVIYAAEKYKRADSIVAPLGGSPMQISGNSPMVGGVGFGSGARGPVVAQQGGGDSLHEAVVNFMKEEGAKSDNGANIHDCISRLCSSGKFTEAQVRQQVDMLCAEGLIYSTVSEDYYQHSG